MTRIVFPTPTRGQIFSQNETGCKPMREENVPAVADVTCRRAHASSGNSPNVRRREFFEFLQKTQMETSQNFMERRFLSQQFSQLLVVLVLP